MHRAVHIPVQHLFEQAPLMTLASSHREPQVPQINEFHRLYSLSIIPTMTSPMQSQGTTTPGPTKHERPNYSPVSQCQVSCRHFIEQTPCIPMARQDHHRYINQWRSSPSPRESLHLEPYSHVCHTRRVEQNGSRLTEVAGKGVPARGYQYPDHEQYRRLDRERQRCVLSAGDVVEGTL